MRDFERISFEQFSKVIKNDMKLVDGSAKGYNYIGTDEAGDDVYTYRKVFLLSDGNSQTLPDFSGWTRKDVIDYWNLSGLSIRMEGYGVAYEQSLAPGSSIDPSVEFTIKFREINYVEKETEASEENTTDIDE